ncbi:uncharacterized protein ACA1_199360 [Acanthamoeba castellanii str. Neff]|uniref:G8 domain-containing protein n=1 Tax=Acanthamoeba castellanii (strain ATCC 30010 / Neff) TaxID=1257118 RepID=L8H2F6_ACACF|nr:uncharacterized protein ACA1_199360 [Acanthamoeba castellanii str. Neff]ELR19664.1 hypothetical protein ACA1_199360 [Acanthamoeba castellanii str. Neff]
MVATEGLNFVLNGSVTVSTTFSSFWLTTNVTTTISGASLTLLNAGLTVGSGGELIQAAPLYLRIPASYIGVRLAQGATWRQESSVEALVSEAPPGGGSQPTITAAADARWHQNADVDIVNASTGVFLNSAVLWDQTGFANVSCGCYAAVYLNSGATWQQRANASISTRITEVQWIQQAYTHISWTGSAGSYTAMSPSPTPSATPSPVIQTASNVTIANALALQFYQSVPAVNLVPKVESGGQDQQVLRKEEAVVVTLGSITEVGPAAEVRQTAIIDAGVWTTFADTRYGASQSFVFTAPLHINSHTSEPAGQLQLRYFLFDLPTNISFIDANTSSPAGPVDPLLITPDLAKMSVALQVWPWLPQAEGDHHELVLRFTISPPFTSFVRRNDTPQAGITTFELSGQHAGEVTTTLRLVDVVELDGQAVLGPAKVSFDVDPATSQLVLRFGHFNSTLLYDPGTQSIAPSTSPLVMV